MDYITVEEVKRMLDVDDDIGVVDCCENNNMHGDQCDNLTCWCKCHD